MKSIITAILSIGQVQVGETWLAGWLLCSVLYFVFLLIRAVVIHYGIAAVYGLIL